MRIRIALLALAVGLSAVPAAALAATRCLPCCPDGAAEQDGSAPCPELAARTCCEIAPATPAAATIPAPEAARSPAAIAVLPAAPMAAFTRAPRAVCAAARAPALHRLSVVRRL